MKTATKFLTTCAVLGTVASISGVVASQPYGQAQRGENQAVGAAPGERLHIQMDALQKRVNEGLQSRRLDADDGNRALEALLRIRSEDTDIRSRNGGRVSELDRDRLQQQLDELDQRITRNFAQVEQRNQGQRRDFGRSDAGPGGDRGPGAPYAAGLPRSDNYGQRDDGRRLPRDSREFWSDAPLGIHAREDWMEQRVRRGIQDGSITRDEAQRAFTNLRSIRLTEATFLRRHRGVLTSSDRLVLQSRLDGLGQAIGWMRRNDQRRY